MKTGHKNVWRAKTLLGHPATKSTTLYFDVAVRIIHETSTVMVALLRACNRRVGSCFEKWLPWWQITMKCALCLCSNDILRKSPTLNCVVCLFFSHIVCYAQRHLKTPGLASHPPTSFEWTFGHLSYPSCLWIAIWTRKYLNHEIRHLKAIISSSWIMGYLFRGTKIFYHQIWGVLGIQRSPRLDAVKLSILLLEAQPSVWAFICSNLKSSWNISGVFSWGSSLWKIKT